MQISIPTIRKRPNFSFKKITASIVAKTGEEVVPISAILMAVVKCPATYTQVLKRVMPVKDTQNKYFQLAFTIFFSAVKFFHAIGAMRMVAVIQR